MVKLVHKLEIVVLFIFIALSLLITTKYYFQTTDDPSVILPVSEDFSAPLNWMCAWGTCQTYESMLGLSIPNSLVYYESFSQSDYKFEIGVKNCDGCTISLLARLKNTSDYTSCVFDKDYLAIKSIVEGKDTNLRKRSVTSDRYRLNDNTLIGIKVKDDYIQCFIGDTSVLHYKDANMRSNGGVGVKINSDKSDVDRILIDSMVISR